MAFPNMQLHALAESLVAYAMSKGWRADDVDAAFSTAMAPLYKREKEARVRELAGVLTLSRAQDDLIHAMGEHWDSAKMGRLFEALRLRFPKHAKTIKNIDNWAGDASNEREECDDSRDYHKLADKALNALERLPWPKPVQVDKVPG